MPINLHGRSVLSLDDLDAEDIRYLLRLAADLKAAKLGGYEVPRLMRKNIALIFERTRHAPEPGSRWQLMTRAPTSPTWVPPAAILATRNR